MKNAAERLGHFLRLAQAVRSCTPAPCSSFSADLAIASSTVCCDVPGARLALIVTCRVRPRRLIWAGPVPCSKRTTSSSGTVPNLLDGTVTIFSSSSRLRTSAIARTWTSYCSPFSL